MDTMNARRFNVEMSKLMAETAKAAAETRKLNAESGKLMAEQTKLLAESMKLSRDSFWQPVAIASGLIGAVVAATTLVIKLIS
jgi:hypothetical protein